MSLNWICFFMTSQCSDLHCRKYSQDRKYQSINPLYISGIYLNFLWCKFLPIDNKLKGFPTVPVGALYFQEYNKYYN